MCKGTYQNWSCDCTTLLGDIALCEMVKFCLNDSIDGEEWMTRPVPGPCTGYTAIVELEQLPCELCRNGNNSRENLKKRNADEHKRQHEFCEKYALWLAKRPEMQKKAIANFATHMKTAAQMMDEIVQKALQKIEADDEEADDEEVDDEEVDDEEADEEDATDQHSSKLLSLC